MLGEPRLSVLLAGMALLHLLALGYAVLRGPPAGRTSDEDTAEGDDGAVVCPECGADNEAGYRYCGGCASELPGTAPTTTGSHAAGDGNLL